MWVPMYLGCTSVVVPDGEHLDFEVVRETMAHSAVTVAHFVPSVLSLFLDFVSPGDLPALRQISCTGEALLLSHREKLTKKMGRSLPLFNLYGPTEAAIEVTYYEAKDDEEGAAHGFPIGFPGDDGVHMYCTDPNDPTVLMPAGAKGEICIGGIQVAHGYLNRPELTAEKFVPNPHGPPGLLYRTGDLGTISADGLLKYNGRADRQVALTPRIAPPSPFQPLTPTTRAPSLNQRRRAPTPTLSLTRSRWAECASSWVRSRRSCSSASQVRVRVRVS